MNTITTGVACRWCGMYHGALCPAVAAIEYFADGSVKRVEFKTAVDRWGRFIEPLITVTGATPTEDNAHG